MQFRYIEKVALTFAACFLLFAGAQAQDVEEPNYTDVDLGEREAGQSYPLVLGAENRNCSQLLDFRFSSKTPWLRMPADPVVRQVPAGQTKTIEAILDLADVTPGQHEGFVDVDCANCGFFIFKNCKIDKQQLRLLLQVNAAPAPPGGAQPAQGGPLLSPPPPQVDYKDKRIPKHLRKKAKAAFAAWTLALKKAKDCADELAKLQAAAKAAREEADKTKVAADTAEQDARNAKAQKKAAQEELKNANIEANKAQDAIDRAKSDLKYANGPNGITAERVAAKAALKKAKAAKKAADKRVADAAKASRLHSPRDLAKLDKETKKKRAAADKAAAAAKAAEDEAAKKQSECQKLQQAAVAAQAANEKAEKDAKDAIPPAPVDRTAEKIKKQREKVGQCATELGQLLEAQRLALEAMAKLGALGDDYESDLKAWADGVDDAKKFFEDLPPVGIPFVDTVVSALTAVRSILGVVSALDKLANTVHTPKSGNDVKSTADTKQWIIDNGFTKDPAEAERIYDQMKKYSETDSTEKMQKELDYQRKLCKAEEAKLDAMTEAAKGK